MQKEKNSVGSYLFVLLYVIISSLGMVLIKKGGLSTEVSIDIGKVSFSVSWAFIIGVILYALSFLLWILILQLFPLTYISPVAYGLVFISVAILSYFIQNIKITREQLLGAVIIVLGILIASKKN